MKLMQMGDDKNYPDFKIDVDVKDYLIGGKMVSARFNASIEIVDSLLSQVDFKQFVKKQLCAQLIEYVYDKRLIEFTVQTEPGFMTKTYRARCYLAPDEQIKIIRTHGG